jgi:hypothetical protein
MADISGAFEVDGLVRTRNELEALLSSNPEMEKKIQGLVRKVLMAARKQIMGDIPFKHGDPRQSVKAVKTAVYKRILGGSVSLYNKRGTGKGSNGYEPPRKGSIGRGGNRRSRSARTQQIMSYEGSMRAFVLRFLSEGVSGRAINFEYNDNRRVDKWNKHPNTGNRGNIAPRNFFANSSHKALQQAAEQLDQLINELIAKEFGKE